MFDTQNPTRRQDSSELWGVILSMMGVHSCLFRGGRPFWTRLVGKVPWGTGNHMGLVWGAWGLWWKPLKWSLCWAKWPLGACVFQWCRNTKRMHWSESSLGVCLKHTVPEIKSHSSPQKEVAVVAEPSGSTLSISGTLDLPFVPQHSPSCPSDSGGVAVISLSWLTPRTLRGCRSWGLSAHLGNKHSWGRLTI